MEQSYEVRKWKKKNPVKVTVPGSKSITNRALMLAAISECTCVLDGVLFSDDSRAFLSCLRELGFGVTIEEERKRGQNPESDSCDQCAQCRNRCSVSDRDVGAGRRRL